MPIDDSGVKALRVSLKQQSDLSKAETSSSNPLLDNTSFNQQPIMPVPSMGQTGHILGSSKYDQPTAIGDLKNVGQLRHERQSGLAQTANALYQAVGGEVIGGMVEGVGYLLDIQDVVKSVSGANQEWGNWLSDIGKGIKEHTREVAPIYKDPNADAFDPLSYSWWMSHVPSVASTLSLMIPAAGTVGAISKVGKVLNAGKALGKVAKGLDMSKEAIRLSNSIAKGTGMAVISRQMESTMEAAGTYDEAYNTAMAKLKIAPGEDDSEARRIASDAAQRNYALNWIALIQDIPQYMLLGKAFPKATTNSISKAKHLKKSIVKPFATKAGLLAWDAVGEGIEEGYQFMTDEESKYMSYKKAGLTDEEPFSERLNGYIGDGEMWSAAFFGALGGALMQTAGKPISQAMMGDPSAITHGVRNLANRAKRTFSKDNEQTIAEPGDTGSNTFNGKNQVDDIKGWGAKFSAVQNVVRTANEDGNTESIEHAQAMNIDQIVLGSLNRGNGQDVLDMLDTMANPSEQDMKKYGFEDMSERDIADFKQSLGAYKERTKKIMQLWEEQSKALSKKRAFVNMDTKQSADLVTANMELILQSDRNEAMKGKIDQRIAEIEQETPEIKNLDKEAKDVMDLNLAMKATDDTIAILEKRLEDSNMDGFLKSAYTEGVKDLKKKKESYQRLHDKSKSELNSEQKKQIKTAEGSLRFARYSQLLRNKASLENTGTVNSIEQGELNKEIEKRAKENQEYQAEQQKASEKTVKEDNEKLENDIPALSLKGKQDTKTTPQENEPTTADVNKKLKDLEEKSTNKQQQAQPNDPDDTTTEESGTKHPKTETPKKRDGLLGNMTDITEDPETGQGNSQAEIYMDTYIPEQIGGVFAIDMTFADWAIQTYITSKLSNSNFNRDLPLIASRIEQIMEGQEITPELQNIIDTLRTLNINPNEFIKFVDEHLALATGEMNQNSKVVKQALQEVYNALHKKYGMRTVRAAQEFKEHYDRVQGKVLSENAQKRQGPENPTSNETDLFTAEPQFAMVYDKDLGGYKIIYDNNGDPQYEYIHTYPDGKKRSYKGDINGQLNWEKLNTEDFKDQTVYFEYDVGNGEYENYNDLPGDGYTKDLIKPQGNEHTLKYQVIWMVVYSGEGTTGERTVIGKVPGAIRNNELNPHIMNLREQLDKQFKEAHDREEYFQSPPNYNNGQQIADNVWVRARTTTVVTEQLPGRLNINSNSEHLTEDILSRIAPEDLHFGIWGGDGKWRGDMSKFPSDLKKSIGNTLTDNLKPGALYVFLRTSKKGQYIPTRLYTNIKSGSQYMKNIIDVIMELKKPETIWADVNEKLQNMIYTSQDFSFSTKNNGRALYIFHIKREENGEEKKVIDKIDFLKDTPEEIEKKIIRNVEGRFAMVRRDRINGITTGGFGKTYNQKLVEGIAETGSEETPAPFIQTDVKPINNVGPGAVYTHSTKFRTAMPSTFSEQAETKPKVTPTETPKATEQDPTAGYKFLEDLERKANQEALPALLEFRELQKDNLVIKDILNESQTEAFDPFNPSEKFLKNVEKLTEEQKVAYENFINSEKILQNNIRKIGNLRDQFDKGTTLEEFMKVVSAADILQEDKDELERNYTRVLELGKKTIANDPDSVKSLNQGHEGTEDNKTEPAVNSLDSLLDDYDDVTESDEDSDSFSGIDINTGEKNMLLSMQGNEKLMAKAEKIWFERNLPGVPLEILDSVKYIVTSGGAKAWAVFQDAAVKVVSTAPEGVLYHEAFHAVFTLGLNGKQQEAILKEAAKRYGKPIKAQLEAIKKEVADITTDKQATARYYEEQMAEEFREYSLMGGTAPKTLRGKIAQWFKNLYEFGRRLAGARVSVDSLFYGIYNGRYKVKKLPKYAKSTPSYMSQNKPDTMGVEETQVFVRQINSMIMSEIKNIARERFGTERPHMQEVLRIIHEYNTPANGRKIQANNPYKGLSGLYYGLANKLQIEIKKEATALKKQANPSPYAIQVLINHDKLIKGLRNPKTKKLDALARAAGLGLTEGYGIRTKVIAEKDEALPGVSLIDFEEVQELDESDAENNINQREGWSIVAGDASKKDTASFRIKFMLGSIPVRTLSGDTVKTSLNAPLLSNWNELYNKIQRRITIEKTGGTKEGMFRELNGMVESAPEVAQVIELLEIDPILSAEFLSTMTTTNSSYLLALEKKGRDGGYVYQIIESNRRTLDKLMRSEWKESMNNPGTTPLGEKNLDTPTREKYADNAISLLDNFMILKQNGKSIPMKTLREFSELSIDLGVHTAAEVLDSIFNGEKNDTVSDYIGRYKNIIDDIRADRSPFDVPTDQQMTRGRTNGQKATDLTVVTRLNSDHSIHIYESGFTSVENKKIFSHRNPNFISKQLADLTSTDDTRRGKAVDEYKQDQFFDANYLLNEVFGKKENAENVNYAILDGLKRGSFTKGKTFRKLGEKDMYITALNAYFNGKDAKFGWFKAATLSDSPSSIYVKAPKQTVIDAKEYLLGNIMQEANRIDNVKHREDIGVTPIDNYDIDGKNGGNGAKFMFFPFMNDVVPKNTKNVLEWVQNNEAKVKDALNNFMEENFRDFKQNLDNSGVVSAQESFISEEAIQKEAGREADINDAGVRGVVIDSLLKRYYWNAVLFNVNMIQLTSGDKAFYSTDADFQKRNKQIYSPGLVIDTKASYQSEENGEITSVGETFNTIHVEDNYFNTSQNAEAIKEGLTARVKAENMDLDTMTDILAQYGYGHNPDIDPKEKQFLVVPKHIDDKFEVVTQDGLKGGKVGKELKSINETDGQAYITLDRFRKIYIGLGRWNNQYEAAYQRALRGQATGDDITNVFRPLKPFYFGNTATLYGRDKDSESRLLVPTQNKNSEFVLLPQMVKSSKKLSTLLDYMNKHDIDSVNFVSAVKVGGQGAVPYSAIEKGLTPIHSSRIVDPKKAHGKILVHQNSNEYYKLQQETPDHYEDFEIKLGTQIAKLIIADLADTGKTDYILENGQRLSPEQVMQSFQDTLSAGIITDYAREANKFADIESLQSHLIEQLRSNGYGDMVESAFNLITDKQTGEQVFKLSLNNPLYSKETEQVLNAGFKKGITQRKAKGGQFVQVTSFGFSDELKLVTENNGLKYMEVKLPWWTKKFFPVNTKGEVDITKVPAELRDLVGYRIPTEDKYSMAPLRVVDFLPKEAGGSIILPADITTIAGSDFDIDKLYVLIPEFKVLKGKPSKVLFKDWNTNDDKDLEKLYNSRIKRQEDQFKKELENIQIETTKLELSKKNIVPFKDSAMAGKKLKDVAIDLIDQQIKELGDPAAIEKAIEDLPTLAQFKETYRGTPAAFFNSKAARNNHLMDIMQSVLRNEFTFDKFMNPGSFQIYKDVRKEINKAKGRDAKKNNIILPQDDIEYSLRNNAGAELVGIAANHNTNHAIFQHTDIRFTEGVYFDIGKDSTTKTSLNDKTYTYYNEKGEKQIGYISKNLASVVAMVVDNAKDPVSGDINLNTFTADTMMAILRTGYHHTVAATFIAHPAVEVLTNEYYNNGATNSAAKKANLIMTQALKAGLRLVDPKIPTQGKAFDKVLQTHYVPSEKRFLEAMKTGKVFYPTLDYTLRLDALYKSTSGKLEGSDEVIQYEAKLKEADQYAKDNGYTSFKDLNNKVITKDALLQHLGVLNQFEELRSLGQDLSSAVNMTRAEAKGAGPGIAESTAYLDKYNDSNEYPETIAGLYTFMSPESAYKEDDKPTRTVNIPIADVKGKKAFTTVEWTEGKYSSPHNFAEFGIAKPTELMDQHYIWNSEAFRTIRSEIQANMPNERMTADQMRYINYNLYTYIANGFEFYKDNEKRNIIQKFPQELLMLKQELKENKNSKLARNRLLNKLIIRTDKNYPRIEFDNGSPLGKGDKALIQESWQEMFNGSPQERDIAIKLAKYSFHTLGFIFNPYSFGHLLTPYYYSEVLKDDEGTFDDYIRKMRMPGGYLSKDGRNSFRQFKEQFFMNHAYDTSYVPKIARNAIIQRVGKEVTYPSGIKKQPEFLIKYTDANTNYFFPIGDGTYAPKPFISEEIYNNDGTSEFILYKLVEDNLQDFNAKEDPSRYVRVNRLGIASMLLEYRYEVPGNGMSSVVPMNNISKDVADSMRTTEFITKNTINTQVRVDNKRVFVENAKVVLEASLQSLNERTEEDLTLDILLKRAADRIKKDNPKGMDPLKIAGAIGALVYDNVSKPTQGIIKDMLPSFSSNVDAGVNHDYQLSVLGKLVIQNVHPDVLSKEQQTTLEGKQKSTVGALKAMVIEAAKNNAETTEDTSTNNVRKFKGFWKRSEVEKDTDSVYLFGDNTHDRTVTKYVPSMTQAVIRGLPNALGIDTKKTRGKKAEDYFTDADFDMFKKHVDSVINTAKASGKTIVIPADGIGTGKAMLKQKAPKLYEYLTQELDKLENENSPPDNGAQQLYSLGIDDAARVNTELEEKIVSILEKNGITVRNGVENLKTRKGLSALAIADLVNRMILVGQGVRTGDILTEEAAHFIIGSMDPTSDLYKNIMNLVTDTQEYADVLKEYGQEYGNDVRVLKEEAAGKLLAREIAEKGKEVVIEDSQPAIIRLLKGLWKRFKRMLSRVKPAAYQKDLSDILGETAEQFLNGEFDVSNPMLSGTATSEMALLTDTMKPTEDYKVGDNVPIELLPDDYEIQEDDVVTGTAGQKFVYNENSSYLYDLLKKQELAPEIKAELSAKMDTLVKKMIAERKRRMKALGSAGLSREQQIQERGRIKTLNKKLEESLYLEAVVEYLNQAEQDIGGKMVVVPGKHSLMNRSYYSQGAMESLDQMQMDLNSGTVQDINEMARNVRNIGNFIVSYKKVVEEIQKSLLDINTLDRDNELGREFEQYVKNILNDIKVVEQKYYTVGGQLFTKFLGGYMGRRNETGELEDLDISETLKVAEKDISFYDLFLDSMAEASDDILKLMDSAVKSAKYASQHDARNDQKDLLAAQEKLEKAGHKNVDFVYEEYDGKKTGNILSAYGVNYEAFNEAREEFKEELGPQPEREDYKTEDAYARDNAAWIRKLNKWDLENTEVVPDKKEIEAFKKAEMTEFNYGLWQEKNLNLHWKKGTEPKLRSELRMPKKSLYADPVFNKLDNAQKEFLDVVWKIKHKTDAKLGAKFAKPRQAPMIRKDVIETLKDARDTKAARKVLKRVKENFVRTEDDTAFGGVAGLNSLTRDAWNRPVRNLPVFFTKKMEDMNDLSTDIVATLSAHSAMAHDYAGMESIIHLLEVGKDYIMDERDVPVGENIFKAMAKKVSKKKDKDEDLEDEKDVVMKESGTSNSAKRVKAYFEMQIYGHYKSDQGEVMGMDHAKLVDTLGSYVAINSLALNIYAGFANILFGSSSIRIEAAAEEFFDHKDLLYADKTYSRDLPKLVGEIGKKNKTSKLALFTEYLDTLQDFDEDIRGMNTTRNTRLSNLANMSSLFFINHAGEHFMQNRSALAMANRIKLKDKDGTLVNLYDAMHVVGNKLVLREEFEGQFDKNDMAKFRKKLYGVNQSLHGVYNNLDKSYLQQNAYGRLATMFRKFLVPAINRRFGKKRFNFSTDSVAEGYYRGTWNFLNQLVKDIRGGEVSLPRNWNNLSAREKQNFMRTMYEAAYMVGLSILSAILVGMAEDDDDNWYLNMLAYQATRVLTEFKMYVPVLGFSETLKILKSPAAAVNQLNSFTNLIDALLDLTSYPFTGELDRMRSGQYKGMLKVNRYLMDLLPTNRTLRGWMTPEEKLKYFSRPSF